MGMTMDEMLHRMSSRELGQRVALARFDQKERERQERMAKAKRGRR